MQFQVPQFIEVEDKIFGPLTFKQFVYVGGGAGLAYLLWRTLPIYVSPPLILATSGLGIALAFMKYNNRPLIVAMEHGFYYIVRSKLYLWSNARRDKRKKAQQETLEERQQSSVFLPKLSESKLRELSWSLDIKEKIAAGIMSDQDREAHAEQREGALVAPIRTARSALIQQ